MTEQTHTPKSRYPQSLEGMHSALNEMLKEPEPKKNTYYQAVLESCPIIDELLQKGHTYQHISTFLKNSGVHISEITLKKHHLAIKQKSNKRPKNRQRQAEQANPNPPIRGIPTQSTLTTEQTASKLTLADDATEEQPALTSNQNAEDVQPSTQGQDQPLEQNRTLHDYRKQVGPDFDPKNCPPPPPMVSGEIVEE